MLKKLFVDGDVAINTDKFNVTALTGNTNIAGTLDVTLATTLADTLDVTGTTTLDVVNAGATGLTTVELGNLTNVNRVLLAGASGLVTDHVNLTFERIIA